MTLLLFILCHGQLNTGNLYIKGTKQSIGSYTGPPTHVPALIVRGRTGVLAAVIDVNGNLFLKGVETTNRGVAYVRSLMNPIMSPDPTNPAVPAFNPDDPLFDDEWKTNSSDPYYNDSGTQIDESQFADIYTASFRDVAAHYNSANKTFYFYFTLVQDHPQTKAFYADPVEANHPYATRRLWKVAMNTSADLRNFINPLNGPVFESLFDDESANRGFASPCDLQLRSAGEGSGYLMLLQTYQPPPGSDFFSTDCRLYYSINSNSNLTSWSAPQLFPNVIGWWEFEDGDISVDGGGGQLFFTGVTQLTTFPAGNDPSSNSAAGFSGWPSSPSTSNAVTFNVPTTGHKKIKASLDLRRNSTGPTSVAVYYTAESSQANYQIYQTFTATTSYQNYSIDLSNLTSVEDKPQFYLQLRGYNGSGELHLDNFLVYSTTSPHEPIVNPPFFPGRKIDVSLAHDNNLSGADGQRWIIVFKAAGLTLATWENENLNASGAEQLGLSGYLPKFNSAPGIFNFAGYTPPTSGLENPEIYKLGGEGYEIFYSPDSNTSGLLGMYNPQRARGIWWAKLDDGDVTGPNDPDNWDPSEWFHAEVWSGGPLKTNAGQTDWAAAISAPSMLPAGKVINVPGLGDVTLPTLLFYHCEVKEDRARAYPTVGQIPANPQIPYPGDPKREKGQLGIAYFDTGTSTWVFEW